MGRILKYALIAAGAAVALLVVAAVTFSLLFDPNDFRDTIAKQVEGRTGREFVIEGDLDVSLFPWLAIDVGRTRLGNAGGFGDEPMASFERARLSVKLLPLIFRREISVGTAELDTLVLNLAVKRDGQSNWDDLAGRDAESAEGEAGSKTRALDVASVSLVNASIRYDDAEAGERYLLSDMNLRSGSVRPGKPVPLSGGFAFRLQPAETSGTVEFETVAAFDTDAGTIALDDLSIEGATAGDAPMRISLAAPAIVLDTNASRAEVGEVRLSVFDVDIEANVEPFSYADAIEPVASIEVGAFSPKSLMRKLDIDVPETADPAALGKLILSARAEVGERAVRLSKLDLTLDETRFTGTLSVPRGAGGTYQVDLAGDAIDLDRYMAPGGTGGGAGTSSDAPAEIPAEMIRTTNARGTLKIAKASLGGMRFENLSVGLNAANGRLRLNPLSAKLFGGTYQGDVRIDASGRVPVLSVDERIQDLSLGALAEAMFDQKDITGRMNGSFRLEGRGSDMAQIQKSLAGNMSFVLSDGIWHGTDVWYQLRRARALFRKEPAPEPVLPAQTRFSEVSATGVVSEGVMRNDDFKAELPFMQLTGRGTVDFPTATVDYSLSGRVLERPEFATAATPEELSDLTRAVIPIRVTGPLAEPAFRIDFASLVRERVKEEVRDRLLDRLLGGSDKKEDAKQDGAAAAEAPADAAGEAPDEAPQEEQETDPEDELKKRLKELFD